MRFSIIIPVYNVEKYIRKCMQTVMEQTFRDYEVIVVDDETPDNSMAIVEEFAEQYPGMVKIIHQKNTRQGGARNRGVQEATGEYILFVDSDDYVSLQLLEIVDGYLQRQPCDILCFPYEVVTPKGKRLRKEGYGALQPGSYVPAVQPEVLALPVGPVLKVFRRAFYIQCGIPFPEKVLYEDTVVRALLAKASSIVLIKEYLYFYVQSDTSSMRRKPSKQMLDILYVTDLVLNFFQSNDLYDIFSERLEAASIEGILSVLDIINQSQPDSELQKPLVRYILDHFPQYQENPYLIPQIKKGLSYLSSFQFEIYHHRIVEMDRMKQLLRRCVFIDWLNHLRWKIRAKGIVKK